MIFNRSQGAAAVLTFGLFAWSCQIAAQSANADFELSVVASPTSPPTMPKTVWIGIRNRTAIAKLVCIQSRAAWSTPTGEVSRFDGDGYSPHSCLTDSSYSIIGPNETLYVTWDFPRSLKVRLDQQVAVSVGIAIKQLWEGPRVLSTVRWTGSGADMIA